MNSLTWSDVFANAYGGFKCGTMMGLTAVAFVATVYCLPVGLWIGTTWVKDTYAAWRLKRLQALRTQEEALRITRRLEGK